jgi:hypothetical protein
MKTFFTLLSQLLLSKITLKEKNCKTVAERLGMKHTHKVFVALVSVLGLSLSTATSAANTIAYMSSQSGEPWFNNSNILAMNYTFGAEHWDRINFGDSINGYSFVYVDGGDFAGADFYNYVSANQTLLEKYVTDGGRLFLNVASNDQVGEVHSLVFGATTEEGGIGYSSNGYAVDPLSSLFAGAGTSWNGDFFSHNNIVARSDLQTMITGDSGQTILAGGPIENGYLLLGGQTNSNFHTSSSGNPFGLRMNELGLAAGVSPVLPIPSIRPDISPAIPEPETYAMLLAGLGLVGFMARRKKLMRS